ncbi:hypothetical protein EON83_27935 [bacterium]|nr:MAG: hypothetical protein EON83_27935 [bacterium]
MNPLDSYLARVAHELRSLPQSKREDELKELRSHLQQRVEDFQHGLKIEEAQQQAVCALGAPNVLGARLADAWEGIPFSWWRVAATCAVTTMIWILSSFIAGISMALGGTFSGTALLPELFPLIMVFYLSVPVLCGALFTHWLGRRGRLFASIYFTFLFVLFDMNLHYNTYSPSRMSEPPIYFTGYINSTWGSLINTALGFLGAYLLHTLKTRKRARLAEANGLVFDNPPVRLLRIPFNPKTWLYGIGICALLALTATARVWHILHPSNPLATLRYSLITGGMSDGFEAPQFIRLQELPPATPAELAGNERRVRFEVKVSAKPYFQSSQLAYLRRKSNEFSQPEIREAMARVRTNSHTVRGVAHLTRTPRGWRVDENSFDRSQQWAWFYVR